MKKEVKGHSGEAKIIPLHSERLEEIQFPHVTDSTQMLCLHTLELLNALLDEHFNQETSPKSG